jgi:hypothetical protein
MGDAIQAAKARFAELEDGVIQKFLKGKVKTDTFPRSIFKGTIDPRVLANLKRTLLNPDGPMTKEARDAAIKEGTATFRAMQGRLLQDIVDAATVETAGTYTFRGAHLKRILADINKGGNRMGIMFDDYPVDVIGFLDDMAKVAEYTFTPPEGTVINYSDTAHALNNMARNYAFKATRTGNAAGMIDGLFEMLSRRGTQKTVTRLAGGDVAPIGLPVPGQEMMGQAADAGVRHAGRGASMQAPYIAERGSEASIEDFPVVGNWLTRR